MQGEWIDISVALHSGMVAWPGDPPFERHFVHQIGKDSQANLSAISGSVHSGTHMDAPLHFIEGGISIDRMPLSIGIGRARVIRIEDPEVVSTRELEPYDIQPGERLLFRTANSERVWKTSQFQEKFVHVPPQTARYLIERKAQLVGVDYLSVGGYQASGAETHRILLGAAVWIVEGLNLASVEPGDYELICLPVKIAGSEGAPVRAVLRKV